MNSSGGSGRWVRMRRLSRDELKGAITGGIKKEGAAGGGYEKKSLAGLGKTCCWLLQTGGGCEACPRRGGRKRGRMKAGGGSRGGSYAYCCALKRTGPLFTRRGCRSFGFFGGLGKQERGWEEKTSLLCETDVRKTPHNKKQKNNNKHQRDLGVNWGNV